MSEELVEQIAREVIADVCGVQYADLKSAKQELNKLGFYSAMIRAIERLAAERTDAKIEGARLGIEAAAEAIETGDNEWEVTTILALNPEQIAGGSDAD